MQHPRDHRAALRLWPLLGKGRPATPKFHAVRRPPQTRTGRMAMANLDREKLNQVVGSNLTDAQLGRGENEPKALRDE